MLRVLKLPALAAAILLTACGPVLPTGPILPTFLPSAGTAPPEVNPAYPTAQAAEPVATQSVGGFAIRLERAWRDGKQVNADVCFTPPDSSDWTIWSGHLDYAGNTVSEFSTAMTSPQDAGTGQATERCDELGFYVPPDADLSAASLTIESVGAYPTSEEYCSLYMPKIQQSLQERGIAINLDCTDSDGTMTMQIVSKPDNMSQDEAEQLVYSDEFYTVKGPWTFPVTFDQ